MSNNPTPLQAILKQMYEDGTQRGQVPQKRKLSQGLHVEMTCHAQGVTLKIARDVKYPSSKEWDTILKNFPYYTGNPKPTMIQDHSKRLCLIAELPTRRQVAEQMRF